MAEFDPATLQRLIDEHGAALRLYARQWCDSPDDAVQEAMIALCQASDVKDAVAWLYVAVRRRAANQARDQRRRQRRHAAAAELRDPWFEADSGQDETPPAGADVSRLLSCLSQLDREIVVARIWGERTFAEIAGLVQHPTSTVHRRYTAALSRMAEAAVGRDASTSPGSSTQETPFRARLP